MNWNVGISHSLLVNLQDGQLVKVLKIRSDTVQKSRELSPRNGWPRLGERLDRKDVFSTTVTMLIPSSPPLLPFQDFNEISARKSFYEQGKSAPNANPWLLRHYSRCPITAESQNFGSHRVICRRKFQTWNQRCTALRLSPRLTGSPGGLVTELWAKEWWEGYNIEPHPLNRPTINVSLHHFSNSLLDRIHYVYQIHLAKTADDRWWYLRCVCNLLTLKRPERSEEVVLRMPVRREKNNI